MKKRVVLLLGICLLIFMIGSVSAFNGDFEVFADYKNDLNNTTFNFNFQDDLHITGNGKITERFGQRQYLVFNKTIPLEISANCYNAFNNSQNYKPAKFIIKTTFDGELFEGLGQGSCIDEENVWNFVDFGRTIIYYGNIVQKSNNGSVINANLNIDIRFYENGTLQSGFANIYYFTDFEKKNSLNVSALELWKQTIDDWKDSIMITISSILQKNQEQDLRLTALENQQPVAQNGTFPQYLNYFSSSERKNIICGYGKDNHLTNIADLGLNCTLSYRNTSRGETSTCRCKNI